VTKVKKKDFIYNRIIQRSQIDNDNFNQKYDTNSSDFQKCFQGCFQKSGELCKGLKMPQLGVVYPLVIEAKGKNPVQSPERDE